MGALHFSIIEDLDQEGTGGSCINPIRAYTQGPHGSVWIQSRAERICSDVQKVSSIVNQLG